MKLIELTQGYFAEVDDSDFELVSKFSWCVAKRKHTCYAVHRRGNQSILLHRFLMNAGKGMQVDHKDHNGLNCQRNNLRICTQAQNNANKSHHKNSSSKYVGVSFNIDKKWIAMITVDRKAIYLGRFDTEIKAAESYNKAALKYRGEFANLNKI